MSKKITLYGKHACFAALNNNKREILKIYVTDKVAKELPKVSSIPRPSILQSKDFHKLLKEDVPHQGIIIETFALPEVNTKKLSASDTIVVLDQVTDPHNVGAIMRSCAAFGVGGIIMPKDNAANESGALAKSACGTLEQVPICRVTNLSRSLDELKKSGFWIIGMDGNTDTEIAKANLSGKNVLVMGAEGKGLRKLTKEKCDFIVKIPINPNVESLNVSNAAAIALYEISKVK